MAASAKHVRPPTTGHAYFRDLVETSLLAAVIGVATGFTVVGVRLAIAFVTGFFFRQRIEIDFLSPAENALGWWVILVPAVGAALAWAIVRIVAQDDRIRGSTEVVRGIATRRGRLSRRKLTGHAAATIVSVGSGGSAGREGAMVQLGAMFGMMASLLLGQSVRHRKILLAAGGAAAIGGTFNTPIAGVIFAMEVILLEWTTRAFIPLTVASAMSTLTTTSILRTSEPAFPIPAYALVSGRELWLYLLLGVLCGLLAIAVLRSLWISDRIFHKVPGPVWLRPIAGGLLVGVIGFLVPAALGVGYETVTNVLQGQFIARNLAVILVAKLLAFAITKGSGGASGAFSPTLFLGSALGGVFGALMNTLFPAATGGAGAYALVGMAAVYAAVTRASLTAVVMLYEMTHTFSIVIPVMLAVVVADALARAYGEGNFYRAGSTSRAAIETDAAVNILDVVSVGEIMSKDVDTVRADAPVRVVLEKRLATGHQGYPVRDLDDKLVGIITATDMRTKVKEAHDLDRPVRDFMTVDPVSVTPSTSAHEALTEMVRMDIGHLPVVDDADAVKLVGFLTRSDVVGVERRIFEAEEPTEAVIDARKLIRRRKEGP